MGVSPNYPSAVRGRREHAPPKPPADGGTGGNPKIWIQFTDNDGNPISDKIYLGRCYQL